MMPFLWIIYSFYAIADWFNVSTTILSRIDVTQSGSSLYTPIIANSVGEPAAIGAIATIVCTMGYVTFQHATKQYKQYYVEYIMADYIMMIEPSNSDD